MDFCVKTLKNCKHFETRLKVSSVKWQYYLSRNSNDRSSLQLMLAVISSLPWKLLAAMLYKGEFRESLSQAGYRDTHIWTGQLVGFWTGDSMNYFNSLPSALSQHKGSENYQSYIRKSSNHSTEIIGLIESLVIQYNPLDSEYRAPKSKTQYSNFNFEYNHVWQACIIHGRIFRERKMHFMQVSSKIKKTVRPQLYG